MLRARVGACLEPKRLHDQVTALRRELSEALEHPRRLRYCKSFRAHRVSLSPCSRQCLRTRRAFARPSSVRYTSAMHNPPPAFAEERRREPVFRISPATALSRATKTRQPVQIADVEAEPAVPTRHSSCF